MSDDIDCSRLRCPDNMTPDTPDILDIVRLVLGIAPLGESDLRGWWQDHALDRTRKYVLSGMFRRTWRGAAEIGPASAQIRRYRR